MDRPPEKSQQSKRHQTSVPPKLANSYYGLLGLHPSASPIQIRRAYLELSKRYHPDTTDLPAAIATAKFQQLNNAYATLSNPERKLLYDSKIGYSRFNVIQAPSDLESPSSNSDRQWSNSAYLDASDRPLSPGEIFALFILGLTFLGCLFLVIIIGLMRGESAWQQPAAVLTSPSIANGFPAARTVPENVAVPLLYAQIRAPQLPSPSLGSNQRSRSQHR